MKVLARYDEAVFPPRLNLVIFDAPHRRMHVRTIQQYRKSLEEACFQSAIRTPIDVPIDLEVWFVNPSSPDLGNLYLALEQAMDGTTLKGSGKGIVLDDGLISKTTMMKLFVGAKKK